MMRMKKEKKNKHEYNIFYLTHTELGLCYLLTLFINNYIGELKGKQIVIDDDDDDDNMNKRKYKKF
jgi:hypothetical protein